MYKKRKSGKRPEKRIDETKMAMAICGSIVLVAIGFFVIANLSNRTYTKTPTYQEVARSQEKKPPVEPQPPVDKPAPYPVDDDKPVVPVVPDDRKIVETDRRPPLADQRSDPPTRKPPIEPKPQPQRYPPNASADDIYLAKAIEADKANKVDQYVELAQWCEEQGMIERAKDQYRNALKLEPDQAELRKKIGHIRAGDNWLSKEEASRRGYYEYQGEWLHANELENRGLALHEGKWIDRADKEKLDARARRDGKKQPVAAREENDNKTEPKEEAKKPEKRQAETLTFPYYYAFVKTAPGYWQECSPPLFFEPLASQLLAKSWKDEQDNYYMVMSTYLFRSTIQFEAGISARGDHVQDIMRAYALYLRNSFDALKVAARPTRNYQLGTFTFFQAEGKCKSDKQPWTVLFAFFKCGKIVDRTYCVTFMAPSKNFTERVYRKADYLLANIDSISTISNKE